MNKLQIIILAIIVFLGIGVRVYKFNQVPATMYVDEVAMYIDSVSVSQAGKDIHGSDWWQVIYPSYGDYKQAVYIWLSSAFMVILGSQAWVTRLPSLLAGVGSIGVAAGLGYVLLKGKHSDRVWLALSSAAVVAFSPWAIHFSRVGFEGHLGQFLLSASVLCYILGFKRRFWLLPAIALGVLSTYSYFSVRFVLPVIFVGYFLIQYFNSSKKITFSWVELGKQTFVQLLIPLFLYAVCLIPLLNSQYAAEANQFRLSTSSILNTDQHILTSNEIRSEAGNTLIDRVIFHREVFHIQALIENYSDNLSFSFLFLTGDQNLRHGSGEHGVFLLSMLPFLVIGLYSLGKRNKLILVFLLLWWLVALLPASIPEETPHALRSLNAYMAVSILIGYGIWVFFTAVSKLRLLSSQSLVVAIKIGVISLSAVFLLHFLHYYFTVYPTLSKDYWFSTTNQVAITALDYADDRKIYTLVSGDKFFLWLIANSEYLGKQFPQESESGYVINSTEKYDNEVRFDDLPANRFVAVLFGDGFIADFSSKYQGKIEQSKQFESETGEKIYILKIGE